MNQLKQWLITSCLLFGLFFSWTPFAYAEDSLNQLLSDKQQALPQEVLPISSLVIDGQNGQILWDEKGDTLVDPGFLTNLMTLYVTYEALDKGEISLTDTITVEESHQLVAQIPYLPSNNLITGVTYTVEDLIKLVSFSNAVGGSLLLADRISEDVNTFTARMNETAANLGLTQTIFTNPSGISFENIQGYDTWVPMTIAGNNQSTAKDLALLAYHLINDYPEILEITKQSKVSIQKGGFTEEVLHNKNPFTSDQAATIKGTNGLLMDLADPESASGIITTEQDGWTVITVMLNASQNFFNEQGVDSFHLIGKNLIENIFKTYEYRLLSPMETVEVEGKKVHVETEIEGAIEKKTQPSFELSEDQLIIKNQLPFLSEEMAATFKIPYVAEVTPIEAQLGDNIIIRFIMSSVEITKLTILAIGLIPIGILIFLMHFFIPKREFEKEESEESYFDFEMNEEVTVSRKDHHQTSGIPCRKITFYGGLSITILGVVLLVLQYIF